MSFDHARYSAHLKRQSMVARGLRGVAARAQAAEGQARHVLGVRYRETTAASVVKMAG